MKNIFLLFSAMVFLICSSCKNTRHIDDSDSSAKISEMNLEETAIAIDREVGEANADDILHCDMLPIGDKPCGGPWGYLVYSKQAIDESRLKDLAERYNELDKIRNEEEELISPCDMAQPPKLTLEKGLCRGEGSYAWNPGYILERNNINIEEQ